MTPAAQILSQRSHRIPGKLHVTEYFFRVPLDYSNPQGATLRIFARGVNKAESPSVAGAKPPTTPPQWLVYFQGGPGFGSRPPGSVPWINAALDAGYRVLLLDGRGTGLSQPVTAGVLQAIGKKAEEASAGKPAPTGSPSVAIAAQAAYLKHFRAPGIVQDAEAIRKALAVAEGAEESRKWSILGQSFGGFCVVTYLSFYPEGVSEAFTSGGLPPLSIRGSDEIYSRLIKRWVSRAEQYYAKFPEDVAKVQAIATYFQNNKVYTPSGGRLSVHRLRSLGMDLGFHGGFERLHNTILRLAADLEHDGELSDPTIDDFEQATNHFDHSIIYAILHEPIYMQGEAANWSAERIISRAPEFANLNDKESVSARTISSTPFYFTAEAITRSVYDDYPGLMPLKDLAEHLAQLSDWGPLYDIDQLARNQVPLYAASYVDDQYVDFELAQATASMIKGTKTYITNSMYHDAVRAKADVLMRALIGLRDDLMD